ncbi:protein kinase [Aspergillus ibericus CBS 121593]|uniref:Protein kinase n=1 Tax=Aspergillus ibericus CBS 121593 TaxID=1448316 RepID=A0A395H0J5_9EURO|nr:protein kinase [Aspergillus ibericus CBS 121593]RAL01113.1 protein kinase [Aspergillus ibericus CBS 121593]
MRHPSVMLHKTPIQTPLSQRLSQQDELVDEEICPSYGLKKYYPAEPGQVLDNRYQILVKVGWGSSSTTWFARDIRGYRWEPEKVVALKIINAESQTVANERKIEEHIAVTDSSHRGYPLFRTHLESFEVWSQERRHLCLAYEPMREPLWIFQRRFNGGIIPLPIVKTYIRFLLTGLDYLHTSCGVVHTDLKLDNVMVNFEDPSVFDQFMDTQMSEHMQYKVDLFGRHVYRCHNDFGPLRKVRNIPKIVDFGLAAKLCLDSDYGIYPIQPDHYRAPEVILGCGWNTSADIWNLGVLLWDLIEGKELFQKVHDAKGHYVARAHLAEMIGLLGSPPRELVAKANSSLLNPWPDPVKGEGGMICTNANEYYGGPFFDDDGNFLFENLIPDRGLADTLHSLDQNERDGFLSLVRMMLTWRPEDRKTASELAQHPFLRLK